MTERHSRGTRWSSSCFQICAALVFLFFMVQVQSTQARVCARRSEVWDDQGKEKLTVDSQKRRQGLNAETQRLREKRKKQIPRCARDDNFAERRSGCRTARS